MTKRDESGVTADARRRVTSAHPSSLHSPGFTLHSRYRGILAFNMAETDEVKKAREDK